MEVHEVLNAAADLLERPGAWTQGSLARQENGRAIGPLEKSAKCWCVSGAILRAEVGRRCGDAWDRFDDYTLRRGYLHMADFNDAPGRTQAEVVAALREAAEQSHTTPNTRA
jgi:hypothetical protein